MNRAERRRLAKQARKQKAGNTAFQPSEAEIKRSLLTARQIMAAGKPAEARTMLLQLIHLADKHPDIYTYLGIISFQLNELLDAKNYFSSAVRAFPQDADLQNNLGTVLEQLGEFHKAIEHYQSAIATDPRHPNAYFNLGNAHRALGNINLAVSSYEQALVINPHDHAASINLGSVLSDLSRHEEALAVFQKLESVSKPNAEVSHHIANQLVTLGKIDEAKHKFLQAIELSPKNGENYRLLTRLQKFTDINDPLIQTIIHLYQNGVLADEDKIHLAFGLGKIFEDLSDFNQAFDYLLEGNSLKRKTFKYSVDDDSARFGQLIQLFSSTDLKVNTDFDDSGIRPIFILGMPRSGTSLIEQILASHPEVHGAGELPILQTAVTKFFTDSGSGDVKYKLDENSIQHARDFYIQELKRRAIHSGFVTDKMPHNFQYVGFIKLLFPEAKIIHSLREPLNNCFSIFKNYFVRDSHKYSWSLEELGHYYQAYFHLMDYWIRSYSDGMLPVRYENIVTDTENQIRDLLEFCGLDWNEACVNFNKSQHTVKTASAAQVRKPVYRKSLALAENYAEKLTPLINILKDTGK